MIETQSQSWFKIGEMIIARSRETFLVVIFADVFSVVTGNEYVF